MRLKIITTENSPLVSKVKDLLAYESQNNISSPQTCLCSSEAQGTRWDLLTDFSALVLLQQGGSLRDSEVFPFF